MGDFWLLLVLVSPVMGALTLRKECRYENTPPKETQVQSKFDIFRIGKSPGLEVLGRFMKMTII